MEKLKIAKLISTAGFCSRRDAEKLVLEGKVKVDGKIITNVAERFEEDASIEINGTKLTTKPETLLYVFYKPIECITTKSDPQKRTTVFDLLPKELPHLVTIGRLDFYSEGALLLTNNKDLATALMSPKNMVPRIYKVKVYGKIEETMQNKLHEGLEIDGIRYNSIDCSVQSDKPKKHHILKMTLYEGKNREIRNICKFFNLKIDRLVRIEYAGISILGMKPGEIRPVPKKIIESLLKTYIKSSHGGADA